MQENKLTRNQAKRKWIGKRAIFTAYEGDHLDFKKEKEEKQLPIKLIDIVAKKKANHSYMQLREPQKLVEDKRRRSFGVGPTGNSAIPDASSGNSVYFFRPMSPSVVQLRLLHYTSKSQ